MSLFKFLIILTIVANFLFLIIQIWLDIILIDGSDIFNMRFIQISFLRVLLPWNIIPRMIIAKVFLTRTYIRSIWSEFEDSTKASRLLCIDATICLGTVSCNRTRSMERNRWTKRLWVGLNHAYLASIAGCCAAKYFCRQRAVGRHWNMTCAAALLDCEIWIYHARINDPGYKYFWYIYFIATEKGRERSGEFSQWNIFVIWTFVDITMWDYWD